MTSVQKLLTNTTNRFQPTVPIVLSQSQSNFNVLPQLQSQVQQINTQMVRSIEDQLLQSIPQTYSQLQIRFVQLSKQLKQAHSEKQLMTRLFEKVFLMEAGQEERMKKRFRRKKNQIQAKYSCHVCSKVYSSSTSLARHAKLKHSYTMMEPPQHDYQIPPQPNSIIESGEHSKPNEKGRNRKRDRERHKSPNQDNSEHSQSDISDSDSCEHDSHESTPFNKGLS